MKLKGKVRREAVSWKVKNVTGRRNAMYKETMATAKGREYGTFNKLDVSLVMPLELRLWRMLSNI